MSGCDIGPAVAEGEMAEIAINALVRRFYALCNEDDRLGPMFAKVIPDFPEHYGFVRDFWSHALLGTDRYQRGTPYSHHLTLTVEEEDFTRWMTAFEQAVGECLPEDLGAAAMQRARHMTESFKMGMLPLPKPGSAPVATVS